MRRLDWLRVIKILFENKNNLECDPYCYIFCMDVQMDKRFENIYLVCTIHANTYMH